MSSREADLSLRRDLSIVSTELVAGVDVVSVTGEFDICYESFLRRLVNDPTRVTQSQVILDLSSVTFIDARGVGAIVYCKRVLAARSAELSLVCPDGRALRVLGLLGFERVLPIYSDRESALLQVSNRPHPRRRRSGR
jgi:anti-sigma B factor antagonist